MSRCTAVLQALTILSDPSVDPDLSRGPRQNNHNLEEPFFFASVLYDVRIVYGLHGSFLGFESW